ncbi:hypothetical protein KSP40_PGU020545 [Platanthera guangdongensis]|uniref:Uncharacterized protein n=1 Tax=Platanthera guangdongensis TaxID=2320717 RepID=A0ABR2LMI8_9ASPA
MGGPFENNFVAGHAAAASSAFILSSSITHPLDTLKTLLQAFTMVCGGQQWARFLELEHVLEFLKYYLVFIQVSLAHVI